LCRAESHSIDDIARLLGRKADEIRAKLNEPSPSMAGLPLTRSALSRHEDPESAIIRLEHRPSIIEDCLQHIAKAVDQQKQV
jgi:hypothetical protein